MGDQFAEWVSEQIEERNAKVAEKGNLMLELDPDVAAAVVYLALDAPEYVTAERMNISGGLDRD